MCLSPPGLFVSQTRGDAVDTQQWLRWCLLTISTHTDLFRGLQSRHVELHALILSVIVLTSMCTLILCMFFIQTPTALNSAPLTCSSPLGQRARQCTGGLASSFSPLKSWRKKTNSRHVGLGCGDLPRTPHGRRFFSTMMYEFLTLPLLFLSLPFCCAPFPSFSLIEILFDSPQCLRCFGNWYLWRQTPLTLPGKLYSFSLHRCSIPRMLHLTVKAPLGVPRASSHSLNSICPPIVYGPIWLTMTLMSCHYPPSPVWFAPPLPSFLQALQGAELSSSSSGDERKMLSISSG